MPSKLVNDELPGGCLQGVLACDSVFLLANSPTAGGAEKQLVMAAAGLQRIGYRCTVCWLHSKPVHPRLKALLADAENAGVVFSSVGGDGEHNFRTLLALRRMVRHGAPSFLWTWGYRADVFAILLRCFGYRRMIVGSLRSANAVRIRRHSWLWNLIVATHNHFISNTIANVEAVASICPAIRKRSSVIYNGIEEQLFQSDRDRSQLQFPLSILMLGNQSGYIKGYDLAIDLAEIILARHFPAVIYVGGLPSDLDKLIQSSERRRVASVIKFVGDIGDAFSFFQRGDIFLMMSRYEGTPNALLEAMAAGIPAIVTPVGDVPCIARERRLRLIEASADSAFHAICDLAADWDRTLAYAAAAREYCTREFNVQRMIGVTDCLFRRLKSGK